MSDWTLDQARSLYNIEHWSGGYFDVAAGGQVVARRPGAAGEVNLPQLVTEALDQGLSLPVLFRFTHILHHRVDTLCGAFAEAMGAVDYEGGYTAVYPIKVNQQRRVVEEILGHGGDRVGLEAGSKPELMAVLALANADNGVVICNGYKDREYIRLALIGRQLGHRVFIVVEKLSELDLVIRESRNLGVTPLLGMRVRLSSIGAGKWQNTGGEKSKFGLSAAQALAMVQRLREEKMLDSLQLLHVHLGSQIANIRDFQRGMREVGRYFVELHKVGAAIRYVDTGGGLAIDYEGTRSRSDCSMNYTVQEYANNVVHTLWEVCRENGLPQPDVITEVGRAMTAHHAVLVTNVIDIEQRPENMIPPLKDGEPQIIANLRQVLDELSARSALEAYHDAVHWLGEAHDMYTHGVLNLEQRAEAEHLYYAICHRVRPLLSGSRSQREALEELNDKLADKYFCNFSVFQSIPDVWAIKQIFPIMPIHRLDEEPTRRAVLEDLTCDSDGRIDDYVDRDGVESSLPLHPLVAGEPYMLGIFLVGAYQEILGDMHNLFGDTDSVNVVLEEDGSHRLLEHRRGDTVESVLRYVQFDAERLLAAYRRKVGRAELSDEQRQGFLNELTAGLSGYTYLED